MPQLNPLDWAPQIIWLVITFSILYVLMKRVALPRIGSVIEARHARIAGDIEAADKLRRERRKPSPPMSRRSPKPRHGRKPSPRKRTTS